jgi:hypothetical protein
MEIKSGAKGFECAYGRSRISMVHKYPWYIIIIMVPYSKFGGRGKYNLAWGKRTKERSIHRLGCSNGIYLMLNVLERFSGARGMPVERNPRDEQFSIIREM